MATSPAVSVVIPSFQQVEFIDEAVTSVLSQEGVDLELVIADHSSTDGTWERVQQYDSDPRVRLYRTPSGGGAPRNWNTGTEIAVGRYVKLLPGDDTVRPGALARQAKLLDEDRALVLVAGKRDVIDARGHTLIKARGLGPLRGRTDGPAAIRATVRSGTNLFGEPGAVMLRRSALTGVGGWDGSHPYAIDEATYIRVLESGAFAADIETVSTFRVSGGQWSVALAKKQAEQMAALHHAVHQRRPDIISSRDVRIGNRRALLLAYQRRLAYSILKGRMQ